MSKRRSQPLRKAAIYSAEERRRRDASPWTRVQAILALLQFAVFLVSLWLVLRYLASGKGLAAATASVVLKTLVLYDIMITGAIWARHVFGRCLVAPAFYWEDVMSLVVLALRTGYLSALALQLLSRRGQMILALAAYGSYVVNAAQFLLKFRSARRGEPESRLVSAEPVP